MADFTSFCGVLEQNATVKELVKNISKQEWIDLVYPERVNYPTLALRQRAGL